MGLDEPFLSIFLLQSDGLMSHLAGHQVGRSAMFREQKKLGVVVESVSLRHIGNES